MDKLAIVEQLDLAITALIAEPDSDVPVIDPDVRELLAIATELRYLPDPGFKMRLKSELLAERNAGLLVSRPLPIMRRREADDAVLPTLFGTGYGTYPVQRANFAASVLMHAAALALVGYSSLWVSKQMAQPKRQVISLVDVSAYELSPSATQSGGGGGGGDRDTLAASKGSLPKVSREQITPPSVVVRNLDPKLAAEPTVVAPPKLQFPQMANLGDPLSGVIGPPSNGVGGGGGIGSGTGTGVGSGKGPGVGPGEGGGIGGGTYRVGGGVTAPRAIYAPDPDYSDEARKNKYQGTVVLWLVVGPDGRPRDMRVSRSLGMGLDQKAMEAVRTWRFEPATKDGHPVAVQINVEVNFHLY